MQLVASGAVETVIAAGEALVDETNDRELDQLLGEAHWVAGNWDRALGLLERSTGGEAALSPQLAWRIGAIHHLRAAPDAALAAYERATFDGSDPSGEAHVLAWKASAYWLRGDADACRTTGLEAVAASEHAGELGALAAAHTALAVLASMEGDRGANFHFERALEASERTRDMLQGVRIRVNWQMPLHEEGLYEQALEVVDEAIRQAELSGFSFYQALGLANRAETLTALGQLEEALSAADSARVIFERLQSSWLAVAHKCRGDAYRLREELPVARAAYEASLSIAEKSHELQMIIAASAGLARVLAREDADATRRLIDRALAGGSWWGHVEAVLSCGWALLVLSERTRAYELAAQAGAEARKRGNPAGIAESLELQALAADDPASEAGRLREAEAIWRRIGNVIGEARCQLLRVRLGDIATDPAAGRRAEQVLRERGIPLEEPHAAGPLAFLPAERSAILTLRTLGGFTALIDGRPVPSSAWQSRKARELVKVLIARRGRRVSRGMLIELLWPGEEPSAVSNRLSVALSLARSVLDLEKRFPAAHFIASDKESVWLVEANLEVDVETFLAEAARSDEPDRLLYAESLYGGDFLEEDVYAEWAISLREEARAAYVEVARHLAHDAADAGDADRATRYLLRLLDHDSFDERAHLELIAILARAGRHGEARRRYREYTTAMEEIGVEPAPFPAPS
jgi:DNA-binding SARP family transcriptional activator